MQKLLRYLNDGAGHQARAVLAHIQGRMQAHNRDINVARWENCREQGYVLSIFNNEGLSRKQLNIAFYESRNSDTIVAVAWEQCTLNSPNIDISASIIDQNGITNCAEFGAYAVIGDLICDMIKKFN